MIKKEYIIFHLLESRAANLGWILILIILWIFLQIQYHPPIFGLWEGSVIYNIFVPNKFPNLFLIIQKGADSVGYHGKGYAFLGITRLFADHFGHSVSIIKVVPVFYGLTSLFLLYVIVNRWFGWKTSVVAVSLLLTNQYFLIMQNELVASSTLSLMLLLFLIERYQFLEIKNNKIAVVSFGFACALAAPNYLVVRLLMVSILLLYAIDIKGLLTNGFSIRGITNSSRLMNLSVVLISMIIFLILFYPSNLKYFLSTNFLFPITREYIISTSSSWSPTSGVLDAIIYNVLYIIKYYVLGSNQTIYSTDLLVDIPYPLASLPVFFLCLIGIVYSLRKNRNYATQIFLYLFCVCLGLVLMSDVREWTYETFELGATINHYRVFLLVLFISVFASLGIKWIYEIFKNFDNRLILFLPLLFILFISIRLFSYISEVRRFSDYIEQIEFDINKKAITKLNPINDRNEHTDKMVFKDRRDFHNNQIYYSKLAKYIRAELDSHEIVDGTNLIVIDPEYYTPDYYRMGGGDIPWKGHPYYFEMYLTFYLRELGMDVTYMVKKSDLAVGLIKRAIHVIERYDQRRNKVDEFPRTWLQERIVVVASIVKQEVESFDWGKRWIDSHRGYVSTSGRIAGYYLNTTGSRDANYVLIIDEDQLDAYSIISNKKVVLSLPPSSIMPR